VFADGLELELLGKRGRQLRFSGLLFILGPDYITRWIVDPRQETSHL